MSFLGLVMLAIWIIVIFTIAGFVMQLAIALIAVVVAGIVALVGKIRGYWTRTL